MIMLTIDWGYALFVTGMGVGTVFLLLIILIGIIGLQTKIISATTSCGCKKADTTKCTDIHPTSEEQAAIAMAMHLYFNAHDEEPHFITIKEAERRYSPWSSKIYNMRNFIK